MQDQARNVIFFVETLSWHDRSKSFWWKMDTFVPFLTVNIRCQLQISFCTMWAHLKRKMTLQMVGFYVSWSTLVVLQIFLLERWWSQGHFKIGASRHQFCFLLTIKKVYTYIYDIKQQLKCTLDFSLRLTFTLDRKKAT